MKDKDLQQQKYCPHHGKTMPCQSCQDLMDKTYTPHREEHAEGALTTAYLKGVHDGKKDQRKSLSEKIEKEIDILPNGHYDHAFRDGLRHALRIIQEEE